MDDIENITINKICAVITRRDNKDIADIWWLFTRHYTPERDFLRLYAEACKREAALDDIAFASSVFEYISEKADLILHELSKTGMMLMKIPGAELKEVCSKFVCLLNYTPPRASWTYPNTEAVVSIHAPAGALRSRACFLLENRF